MPAFDRVRSGIPGMDEAFDNIRLGDNVVFRVSDLHDFRLIVLPYVRQAAEDGRKIIYVRFATHRPILSDEECREYHVREEKIELSHRFETFTVDVHNLISQEGTDTFYVFDCLSVLMTAWATDLMMGNFFRVTCPYLFQLDTVAYFPILRRRHSMQAVAKIQDTTQLFIDVYPDETRQDVLYVRPDKVWNRYSETMFLPHVLESTTNTFRPILDGVEASSFYHVLGKSQRSGEEQNTDSWDRFFMTTRLLYEDGEDIKDRCARMCQIMMSRDEHMRKLIRENFEPEDYFAVKERMIGTGMIGGKACGMLTARKIIQNRRPDIYAHMEPHDSFYVGSDVFYTYIVDNGFWDLRVKQRTPEGYFSCAREMAARLRTGAFSREIEQRILMMLDYYGQDPYIVRSSSILEDGFGNAFAGKYESVFCANQGTKEERLLEFENAARIVYASTMSMSALDYRKKRGLEKRDEQMALLVMRVSGSHYGPYVMPCAAGVGYSTSPYVIKKGIDPKQGMLRLVMGLGTSAVDRTEGSYPRIVNLARPTVTAASTSTERHEFSQRQLEVVSKKEKRLERIDPQVIAPLLPDYIKNAVFEHDWDAERNFKNMGRPRDITFVSCRGLVHNEELMETLKGILVTLEAVYEYPVDTEFTVNLAQSGRFVVNLLQCRPLQMLQDAGRSMTKGGQMTGGDLAEIPEDRILLQVRDATMGLTGTLAIDEIVYVEPKAYYELPYVRKSEVAREIGEINKSLEGSGKRAVLMVPGRVGTSSPELGVPTTFADISEFSAIGEIAESSLGYNPELSYGSHIFQDLVETGILYIAIFESEKTHIFRREVLENCPPVNEGSPLRIFRKTAVLIHREDICTIAFHS